jgi:hypothetical protein
MTYQDAMKKLYDDYNGKDLLIALSTIATHTAPDGKPQSSVRIVDAAYIDGAFYVCAWKCPGGKFEQLENNPHFCATIAIATHELEKNFVAHGYGENLGWVKDEKNADIMVKVCEALKWFNMEHENDPNSCLLKFTITYAFWNNPHGSYRNEINFGDKTVKEIKW